jgi:hypothetical protein
MSLTAYVRYDNYSRIVPGGPIVTSVKPKVGDWVAITEVLTTTPSNKLRAFVRYIKNNKYVAGSLILQQDRPQDGNWKEIYFIKPCESCNPITTTTTTTTCVPFINTIIISNGSFSSTNGTYTRPDIATAFSQVGGTGAIFFGGDAWYLNAGVDGNVARNTSELGTGTWIGWAPGYSTGVTAQYIYSSCGSTTTTTTTAASGTLYLSTLGGGNACSQSGPIYSAPTYTYTGGTGLCNSTSFDSNDVLELSGGTYFVSDGTSYRAAYKAPGAGITLITFTEVCTTC